MMKRLQSLVLILLALSAIMSCDRNKDKYPDRNVKVVENATIKSLKSVFLALDKYQMGNIALANSKVKYPAQSEPANNAFLWGIYISDTMFARAAMDKDRLIATAAELKKIAPPLSLAEEANEYDQRVKTLARQGNWKDIDILNSGLQSTVDVKLMDANKYDSYTLSCLGAWIETTNRLAKLIAQNYQPEKTRVLQQADTWNNLNNNLELMQETTAGSPTLTAAIPLIRKLRDSIAKQDKETFTQEQVEQIIVLTDQIKAVYLQTKN